MLQLPKWPPNACLQLGNYLAAVSCRVFLVDEVGIIDNLCICWKLCMCMCFVCREPTKMSHSASWCKSAALWGVDNQCFIADCNNLEIVFITQSFLICLSIITKCHILKSCDGELFLLTVQKLKILWVHVKNEMSQEKVVQTAKKTWNFEIKILKIQYLHIFSIAINKLILMLLHVRQSCMLVEFQVINVIVNQMLKYLHVVCKFHLLGGCLITMTP